jgi:hypothetical protein
VRLRVEWRARAGPEAQAVRVRRESSTTVTKTKLLRLDREPLEVLEVLSDVFAL